ncbi:hypothetical protein WICPIJ_002204 [Wickerhamomyces pijperi]|uniref:Uncharacterized protein n=1 Tax=Wickerhamomyces pijperi TaxID=599730 RepID=A0A9P8Q9E4_WICPI|nr:hypothetical protein WICPIJ_002204 [Wickerhamomyces pijperi]
MMNQPKTQIFHSIPPLVSLEPLIPEVEELKLENEEAEVDWFELVKERPESVGYVGGFMNEQLVGVKVVELLQLLEVDSLLIIELKQGDVGGVFVRDLVAGTVEDILEWIITIFIALFC